MKKIYFLFFLIFLISTDAYSVSSVAPHACLLYDASGNPLSSTAGALNTTGGGGGGGTSSASHSTLSQVAASITSVSVLSANATRLHFILVNDSTSVCYVAFGATASSSAYTVRLPAFGSYTSDVAYTGALSAIWVSATGNLIVTELTP
jgi:hypothetical protein